MRSVSKARKARKRYMLPMGSEAGMSAGGPIQHGGDLARARALFPEAPEPWVDLSTGINPHSYPYSPLPANAFSRLPEPETRSEEHTSELQSLMRISYAVFCLKKKK